MKVKAFVLLILATGFVLSFTGCKKQITACFIVSDPAIFPGQEVAFTTCSFNSRTKKAITPDDYLWDFGDGYIGTGDVFPHIYGTPGTYTVTLRIKEKNAESSTSQKIVVKVYNTVFNGTYKSKERINNDTTITHNVFSISPVGNDSDIVLNNSSGFFFSELKGKVYDYDWFKLLPQKHILGSDGEYYDFEGGIGVNNPNHNLDITSTFSDTAYSNKRGIINSFNIASKQ